MDVVTGFLVPLCPCGVIHSCFVFIRTTSFLCSDRVRQRERYLALSSLVQALSSFIAELKQKDRRETTDPAAALASQAQREQLRLWLHSSRTYANKQIIIQNIIQVC